MGARCIFDWLVAFVGLVGLYACNVRRLGTEKRNAANFISSLRLHCFGALLVLVVWVVLLVVVLFPFG